MHNDDTSIFTDRYNATTKFDVRTETTQYATTAGISGRIVTGTRVALEIEFDMAGFELLRRDIKRISEEDAAEKLRAKNPALKEAYEAYQILLKLSR